jgi:multiple sugar transport system ATP-binding protein
MGALDLKGVRKSFGRTEVVKGIDLSVADGEFVVFVGPSGCGKSTLLRMIAGLEEVTAGAVLVDGRDVTGVAPAQRGMAMVFQTYALYPHLDVRGNMGLALKQAGVTRAQIEASVLRASAMLALDPYLDRRPAELSSPPTPSASGPSTSPSPGSPAPSPAQSAMSRSSAARP